MWVLIVVVCWYDGRCVDQEVNRFATQAECRQAIGMEYAQARRAGVRCERVKGDG